MGFKFILGRGFVPTEDLDGLIRNAYWWQFKGEELFLDELQAKRDRDGYRDRDIVEARGLLGLDDGLDGRNLCLGDGVLSAIPASMLSRGGSDYMPGYYPLTTDDKKLLAKHTPPVVEKEPKPVPKPVVVQKKVIVETIRSVTQTTAEEDSRSHVRMWLESRGDDISFWNDENIDLMMGPLRMLAMKDMFLVKRSLSPRELVRIVNEKGEYTLYSSLVYERVTRYCIRYHGLWESNDFRVLARWIRRLVNCGGLVDAADIERRYIQATSKPETRTPETRSAEDQLYRFLQKQSQDRFQRIYGK